MQRPAIVQEEVEKLLGARALAIHEGTDDAQFVRRIGVPACAAVTAREEISPVAFKRSVERRLRQSALRIRYGEGDRGGCRVQVTAICASRDIVDVVSRNARTQRCKKIATELVALGLEPLGIVITVERASDLYGTVVPGQGPEVVPVGVSGPVGIASWLIDAGMRP